MDFQTDFKTFDEKYPVRTRQVDGLTFSYRLGGNGEKTVVLLVGGFGISDVFYNHFTRLAESFTVLTFDYPPETCRNSVLADGIAALVKELGLKNVFLVGQSYEGLIAQVIAKRHPEIVSGLVLSNTGCIDAGMDEAAKNYMLQMAAELKKYIRIARVVPIKVLKKILLRKMEKQFEQYSPDERKHLTDVFTHVFGRMSREYEINMCSLMLDLENELESTGKAYSYLDGRVLLLLSEDDHTFDDSVKNSLIRTMPNPVVETKISGGHMALLVNTDLYLQTVIQFINQLENKAGSQNESLK